MNQPYRRCALLALAFLVVEALLIAFIDRPVSGYMRALDVSHNDLINFFRAITDYGKSKWYLWPAAVGIALSALLLHARDLTPAWRAKLHALGKNLVFVFLSLAVSGFVTDFIKPLLGRARPVELARNDIYGFAPLTFQATMNSMPSGHSTTAAALTACLIILYPRWRFLWLALGFTLALSRIMVNAHYVSDVVAGCCVGVVTTLLMQPALSAKGIFHNLNGIFPMDKRRAT